VAKKSTVRILDLMQASTPSLKYKDVKVGVGGGCLDLAVMGVCKAASCTYSHAPPEPIPTTKATKLSRLLTKAATAYVAAS
jgi:hypothetical protein